MIMSTSLVILEVQNVAHLDKKLKDIAYEEGNAFNALSFDSPSNTSGELHWSNSFKYGKMNMVSFFREENFFYLFTSAVENKKVLSNVLARLLNHEVELKTLKTPLNSKLNKDLYIPEVEKIEINKHFGISAWLNLKGWKSSVKVYTNGLITYKMTNDLSVIKEVIAIAKTLIKECEPNIES
ncbi:hypothetical protein [Oceanobacillus sp. J11TS1]|uniref:hypothetical protein n=1 Tax=Oceanobacillus sp. J11TS1 TaxID=2807191 RepID=UPI001B038B0F|nr:hypothetical protein [Oceanobacillus sp. J11TS1]GIO22247.1 hypothetical protein J11TS1_08280 [Oceanobacillus sp. J11TS1]